MRKNELEIVKEVYDKVDHIVNWHNKNLTKKQEWVLLDCLELLEKIGGKK